MIERIKLKNWRSHKDSKFEFCPGINALIGIMGSGKTSVLDALCFALYGTFPAHRAREVTLDDIIRSRPQQQSEASIQVDFKQDENRYRIIREIKRGEGSTKTELFNLANRSIIESSPSRVKEEIESILKADYYLFSRAVYAQQNSLDYFLNLQRGKRKEQIDQLLKLDRFERARKNCSTLIYRFREKRKMQEEFIKSQQEEELEKIPKLEKRLSKMERKRKQAQSKLSYLYDQKSKLSEKLAKFERERKKLENLSREIKSLEGQLLSLKEDMESLKERVLEAPVKPENLKNEYKKKNQKLEEIKQKLSDGRIMLKKLAEKKAGIKERLQQLRKELKEIEKLRNRCPKCKQKLTLEHRKELLRKAREQIGLQEENLSRLKPKIEKMENSEKKFKEKKKQLRSLREKLKEFLKFQARLHIKEEKKEKVGMRKEEIGKKLQEKERKFPEEKFKRLQNSLRKLEVKSSRIEEKVKFLAKRKKDKEKELQRLKKLRERLKKAKEKKKKLHELWKQSNSFQRVLRETQRRLRDDFISAINSTMSNLWQDLYPYEDYQSLKFNILGGDYSLELQNLSGDWVSVVGIASGGERTMASLALRIGFSLSLTPNLGLLVLDEPTHNLDRNAIEVVASLLREKLSAYVDQVFLITHNPELEQAVTGYLYRLDRDKSADGPTQVEKVIASSI